MVPLCFPLPSAQVVTVLGGAPSPPACEDGSTVLGVLLCEGVAARALHIGIQRPTAAPAFLFQSRAQHESWTVNTELLLLPHKC